MHISRLAMISAILIAAGMCLQGGEEVDVSRYVVPIASALELKVTLTPANGTLLIYSPGYENQLARFTSQESFGWVPIAEPILCVKAIGGPFEFDIEVIPMEGVD
jgi:hypothetical protein